MTHTAPYRPYLFLRGVPQIISKSFQVSESKINLIFNTSAHRTGNSSTSTNLHKHCKSEQKQKAWARPKSHAKSTAQLSEGEKKQFVQTVAQMFNGLFTNVYTNQQKKKKRQTTAESLGDHITGGAWCCCSWSLGRAAAPIPQSRQSARARRLLRHSCSCRLLSYY